MVFEELLPQLRQGDKGYHPSLEEDEYLKYVLDPCIGPYLALYKGTLFIEEFVLHSSILLDDAWENLNEDLTPVEELLDNEI